MRNQRLIEALMRTQAAMDFARDQKPHKAIHYIKSAREALALAPEYLKDSQEALRSLRLIHGHLDYAEDDLRAGQPGTDPLSVAYGWISTLIVGHASPGGIPIPKEIASATLTCAVCKRPLGKDETVYANRRTGFSCAQCVTIAPECCPGCGTPKNDGEPGFCMACLADKPDLRENR